LAFNARGDVGAGGGIEAAFRAETGFLQFAQPSFVLFALAAFVFANPYSVLSFGEFHGGLAHQSAAADEATRAADGLPRRAFTVHDIRRMVEAGIIAEDEPFELIDGDLVMMAAKGYAHELIKVRIDNDDSSQRKALAEELAKACEAEVAGTIGKLAILYRPRDEDPEIELP